MSNLPRLSRWARKRPWGVIVTVSRDKHPAAHAGIRMRVMLARRFNRDWLRTRSPSYLRLRDTAMQEARDLYNLFKEPKP